MSENLRVPRTCDTEAVHRSGAIQPHGTLLVVEDSLTRCRAVAANCGEWVGMEAGAVLGRSLAAFDQSAAESLLEQANAAPGGGRFRWTFRGRVFDATMARTGDGWLLELETAEGREKRQALPEAVRRLVGVEGDELFDASARVVADLSGFERVMVYRFDADWHGCVVGEHLSGEMASYRGHHFPAGDIPEPARAIYMKVPVRVIPDVAAKAVPILPESGANVDLTRSLLRSVAPVHLEYLRNMGVGASMSIPLRIDGRLWGLLACHHRQAHPVPPATREACMVIGDIVAMKIGALRELRELSGHVAATKIQSRFFDVIAREQNVFDALVKYTPQLLEFLKAGGAAIHVNGTTTLLGQTPGEAQVAGLLEWLAARDVGPVFATHELSREFPPALDFRDCASGLLALRLSRVERHFGLWFRPEVVATVTWAGPPYEKAVDEDGMHPRKSFATWKETVTGQSEPWTETEIRGAQELLNAVNALVLRRTERLVSLNAELERKNTDLNSFAYIAAHDLKEPLRSIGNYCTFLREDHAGELSVEALRKLDTIRVLQRQATELIHALNHFSSIGRVEIQRQPVRTDGLIDDLLHVLGPRLTETGTEWRRPAPLPDVDADPVLLREVFLNLLTNAIRYNDKPERWVEIGCETDEGTGQPVFYVSDNGIGIRPRHREVVFSIFRRLHTQDAFGGGTGAGLAITKTIVEKHGGRIWIESTYGEGTTFHFTLS